LKSEDGVAAGTAPSLAFDGAIDMIRIADEAARERRHVGQHDLLDRIELLLVRERIARHLLCQFSDLRAEQAAAIRQAALNAVEMHSP
jgi:hypothetical protein